MKCRICGKQIKTGTICENCYKEAMGKSTDNGNRVLIKIGRKFSPKYQIMMSWEVIVLSFLFIICSLSYKRISYVIVSVLLSAFIIGFALFIAKRIANGTKCYFYETKVVYKFDFLFIHRKISFNYSEVEDIIYGYDMFAGDRLVFKWTLRRFLQKRNNIGDIVVYAKKTGLLQRNFIIKDVGNVTETFEKISNTIGEKLGS